MGLLGLAVRGVEVNRALGDDRDRGTVEIVIIVVGMQRDGGVGIIGVYGSVVINVGSIIIIIKEGNYFADWIRKVLNGTGIAWSVTVRRRMAEREVLARIVSWLGSVCRGARPLPDTPRPPVLSERGM